MPRPADAIPIVNAAGSGSWSAVVTVFVQGLSRLMAVAIELPGNVFGGIVVSDLFSASNHLAT
jgi:hypothetical protein